VIALARGQLNAQSAAGDNIDLKAMGLLGFDGALLAANLAARDLLNGHPWWLPLPGLAISIVLCLAVSREYQHDAGPDPAAFYASFGGQTPPVALAQLLVDLRAACERNAPRLALKRRLLGAALAAVLVAAAIAGIVWGFID
jgi:disulfide bond formation protein DsbB